MAEHIGLPSFSIYNNALEDHYIIHIANNYPILSFLIMAASNSFVFVESWLRLAIPDLTSEYFLLRNSKSSHLLNQFLSMLKYFYDYGITLEHF